MKIWTMRHCTNGVIWAFCLLLIAGCETTPVKKGAGINLDQAVPGEEARNRLAHVIVAVENLNAALSAKNVSLDTIGFDSELVQSLAASRANTASDQESALRRLAEREMLNSGPYELVQADPGRGRIEYRSLVNADHVSFVIRKTSTTEKSGGQVFTVMQLYGQSSLSDIIKQRGSATEADNYPDASMRFLKPNQWSVRTERKILQHLESLPELERDREDILGVRAMLKIRLKQYESALVQVEKGIIRYPEAAQFFVLAEVLFSRANKPSPESLLKVTGQRFESKDLDAIRLDVKKFLDSQKLL